MKPIIASVTILVINFVMSCNCIAINMNTVDNKIIAKVLPEAFASLQRKLKGDYGMNDANMVISLVSEANDLIIKTSDPNKQENCNKAYCQAWRLGIEIALKTKEPKTKKYILDKWNNYLMKDDVTVPYQIYALVYNRDPNRIFLTDDFWKLLKKTKHKKTILAISHVLCENGNQEDIERLKNKIKSGIESELQQIIQEAINCMNYRFINDNNIPGPAEGLPPLDFKD